MSYFENMLLPALESSSAINVDDSCKKIALLIVKALIPRFESVEWSSNAVKRSDGGILYNSDFYVTIGGRRYDAFDLAENHTIDEDELYDLIDLFSEFRLANTKNHSATFKFKSKDVKVKDIVGDGIRSLFTLWGYESKCKIDFHSADYGNNVTVEELLQLGELFNKPPKQDVQLEVMKYLREQYLTWNSPNNVPSITASNFWDEFIFDRICVALLPRRLGRGVGIGIMGECNADEEHGVAVVFKDSKLVDICQQGGIL